MILPDRDYFYLVRRDFEELALEEAEEIRGVCGALGDTRPERAVRATMVRIHNSYVRALNDGLGKIAKTCNVDEYDPIEPKFR